MKSRLPESRGMGLSPAQIFTFRGKWPGIPRMLAIALGVVSLFVFLLSRGGDCEAGDLTRGKSKSVICAGCHGADGISLDEHVPSLAGQKYKYLHDQMTEFVSGMHRHGQMNQTVDPFSLDDLDNLASYYASLKVFSGNGQRLDSARGKEKFTLCETCHGKNGEGSGTHPRLAGQRSSYLAAQLRAFKEGVRSHPVMTIFVDKLNEKDFEILADYLSSLR